MYGERKCASKLYTLHIIFKLVISIYEIKNGSEVSKIIVLFCIWVVYATLYHYMICSIINDTETTGYCVIYNEQIQGNVIKIFLCASYLGSIQ